MSPLRIAVLVETATAFGRGVIKGIGAYAKVHGPWQFQIQTGHLIQTLPPRSEWDGDGVIARVETPALARQLRRRNLKVVLVAGADYVDWPFVGTSQAAIALRAADHFLDRGFRRFAYIGTEGAPWSEKREIAFRQRTAEAGCPCSVYRDDISRSVAKRHEKLGAWIQSLEKPVAVFACDDLHGRDVIDVCRLHNITVPEMLSVCGVDNDEPICTMTTPSLSSVPLNTFQIGYIAAQMLERMIRGEHVESVMDIEPLPVATRQSTDLIAIEDPIVANSVKLIREFATQGLTVKTLLQKISCSRRTLEMRFQKAMGRSPHEEIRRVQIERARMLLTETDLKTKEIARLSGFTRAQYLNNVFRRNFGVTPDRYRRQNHFIAARTVNDFQ